MTRNWILLRGLGRCSGHWGTFKDLMKEAFPTDSIEYLDLAGSGDVNDMVSPNTIEEFVHDLHDRRKSQGPISFLALSMGAMVASCWAELYPGEVKELYLINTSSKNHSRFFERLQYHNYFSILQMVAKFKDRKFLEEGILDLTAADVPNRDEVLKRHLDLPPTSTFNWFRQIKASANYAFPEKAPAPKVMFMAAKSDQLVHPFCSKRIASAWNVEYREHHGGAHDLPLIDGAWIIRKIKESSNSQD